MKYAGLSIRLIDVSTCTRTSTYVRECFLHHEIRTVTITVHHVLDVAERRTIRQVVYARAKRNEMRKYTAFQLIAVGVIVGFQMRDLVSEFV